MFHGDHRVVCGMLLPEFYDGKGVFFFDVVDCFWAFFTPLSVRDLDCHQFFLRPNLPFRFYKMPFFLRSLQASVRYGTMLSLVLYNRVPYR